MATEFEFKNLNICPDYIYLVKDLKHAVSKYPFGVKPVYDYWDKHKKNDNIILSSDDLTAATRISHKAAFTLGKYLLMKG